jgi:hypothetical protein
MSNVFVCGAIEMLTSAFPEILHLSWIGRPSLGGTARGLILPGIRTNATDKTSAT